MLYVDKMTHTQPLKRRYIMAIKKSVLKDAPTVDTKKSKKPTKEELNFEKPFDVLVCAAIVEGVVKNVKKTLENKFKAYALEIFHEKIKESKEKPATFKGVCEQNPSATASFQYREKGLGFSQETADKLSAKGVPFKSEVKEGTDRLIINPEILQNEELLEKLDAALNKIKGFENTPIVVRTKPTVKHTFTDATLVGIVENFDDQEQREILDDIATLALAQCQIDGGDAKNQESIDKALAVLADANVLQWNVKSDSAE